MKLLSKFSQLTTVQKIKLYAISSGVLITKKAHKQLTKDNTPISIFEYPTTAGVTFYLEGMGYINAPFYGGYEQSAEIYFDYSDTNNNFFIRIEDLEYRVDLVPLPAYLNKKNDLGIDISNTVMSHTDRVRISPLRGCALNCQFCDLHLKEYTISSIENIKSSLDVALKDKNLHPRHILISGGTPRKKDYNKIDLIFKEIIQSYNLETDIMFTPRADDADFVKRLYDWGLYGYSINIELFDRTQAKKYAKGKYNLGLDLFKENIEKALDMTGGNGRVRSLIIAGLEDKKTTLDGIKWLCEMGCDPVISPFRPAKETKLQNVKAPNIDDLYYIWCEANEIAIKNNVKIGPRCKPCQHNTLTL